MLLRDSTNSGRNTAKSGGAWGCRLESGLTNIIATAIGLPIIIFIFYFALNPYRFSSYRIQAATAVRLAFQQVRPMDVSPTKEPNLPAELYLCGLNPANSPGGSLLCDYPATVGVGGAAFFDANYATTYMTALTNAIKSDITGVSSGMPIASEDWAVDCATVRSPYPQITEFDDPFKVVSPVHVTYPNDAQFDAIEAAANASTGSFRAANVAKTFFNAYGSNLLAWKIDISPDPTTPYTKVIELPTLHVFCSIVVKLVPIGPEASDPSKIKVFQDSAFQPVNNLGGL